MKYKAVVFDLDGTLLDTLEDLADSLNRVLRDKGFCTHPTQAYRYFVGNGSTSLVSRVLPDEKRNEELIADCLAAFRRDYKYNWKVKTSPYNGVPELLDAITDKGVKMAVLTNKPHDFAELCVREFFSKWEFAMILGQREGIPLKPDPVGACEIARSLNIPTGEFLYLGDSGVDMTTAVRAAMFPVGALWGFRSEQELREHGAVETIARPIDFIKFIK